MDYVYFGNSGLKVSRMALGLGLREQHDEQQAERLIHRAMDKGINLFDCANVYGLGDDRAFIGRSEEILGRAVKGKRDDVVITSKVDQPIGSGPNDHGASRYHIMREVERSLRRLGTDHIDVYLLHVYDAATPLDEQFRAPRGPGAPRQDPLCRRLQLSSLANLPCPVRARANQCKPADCRPKPLQPAQSGARARDVSVCAGDRGWNHGLLAAGNRPAQWSLPAGCAGVTFNALGAKGSKGLAAALSGQPGEVTGKRSRCRRERARPWRRWRSNG